jgi:hypothetical protein
VRADHHDVCGGSGLGLGDDVAGLFVPHPGVEFEGGWARLGPQPLTGGLGDADDRNLHVRLLTERAAHFVAVLVVGDDQSHRAAFGGDGLLDAERALATVDQHDGARDRQAVVIGCRAAGSVLDTGRYQWARHPFGRGALGEFERIRRDLVAADRQRWLVGERQMHVELGGLHVETLVPQRVGHVVDAGVVSRCAEGAIAVVGVRDFLQFLQMDHHRVGGHPFLQRRGEVGGPGGLGGGRLRLVGAHLAAAATKRRDGDNHRQHRQGSAHHRHHVSLLRRRGGSPRRSPRRTPPRRRS